MSEQSFPSPQDVVQAIPHYSVEDIDFLLSHLDLARRMKGEDQLSTEIYGTGPQEDEGGLPEAAKEILRDLEYDLTQADQALLCSVILGVSYRRSTFTSRDVNDIIEESGRPRVINITSPVSGLIGHGFLGGSTKNLHLTSEGRTKARDLVEVLRRQREAA